MQDDLTPLLMWNVFVTMREPLDVEEPCRATMWDAYLGLCCSAQCVSGLLPVAQERWMEKWTLGCFVIGCGTVKKKSCSLKRVWVTGIVFWVLFFWCSREKPKLTGSWAAVFYIFLWWCVFGGFDVCFMVRLLSHLHTALCYAWKTPLVLTYFTRAHRSVNYCIYTMTWSF